MPAPIYLDHNATTPIAPEVAAAMRPFLEGGFGNPSSGHPYGVAARKAVEEARAQVAGLLGVDPDEIVFTGGGSESDNLAIKGLAWARVERGRQLVTSAVEHPAVLEVCRWLQSQGWALSIVPVDAQGRVDTAAGAAALRPDTVLVSVMHANNEVGTLQPIAELAALCRERGVILHSDGAQAVGKLPIDLRALGVDLYTVAGHKLYAPKGIGALYVRRGLRLQNLVHGAGHEGGQRAGTENVLGIVGLGAACALARAELPERTARLAALRDRLHQGLLSWVPDARLNGPVEGRLANTLSLSFPGLRAESLLSELREQVAASAGAACHDNDRVSVSAVLRAMGLSEAQALGTLRFSVGRGMTEAEIDQAAAAIGQAAQRLAGQRQAALPTEGPVRLTRYTHGLGCACKLRPQLLQEVLARLPVLAHADALVGTETSDDAAVWRLSDEQAIVATVDLFSPIVDDPFTFGAIAAANALSDVYAMGARPLFALNIVGFPPARLPPEVLHDILRGGAQKATEAGVPVLGGHSVEDDEPRYGMVVIGLVHPDRIWRNRGAREGDALLLTKALGTGILSTAAKRGQAAPADLAAAITSMATLNRAAAEALAPFEVHACTDVTGFGLLGHLRELLAASGVDARLDPGAIPLLPGVLDLVRQGAVPGGSQANLEHVGPRVDWDPRVPPALRLVLADAQTSGGLLVALPAEQAAAALAALGEAGVSAAEIGRVGERGEGRVRV